MKPSHSAVLRYSCSDGAVSQEERHRHAGVQPAKSHRDDERLEHPSQTARLRELGLVSLEKAQERPYQCIEIIDMSV